MKEKKKNLITKQRNMCKVFAEKRIKSKHGKNGSIDFEMDKR